MSEACLEDYISMRDEIVDEYESIREKLDRLKVDGKTKSATFKQLTARKLTLAAMLDIYRKHGLL